MFGEYGSQLPAIIPIQSKTFTHTKVFIPLTELTNLTARENLLLGRLEITLHDQSPVVDQTVLVDYVEDLFVDVD